jgi:hypothetical protein
VRALVRLATLALALGGAHARAAGNALAVPLALEESAGVTRRAWPATASVPFARGRLRSTDSLWVAAPDGTSTLAQPRVIERWPDGSLRWVLLDFLADVPAHAVATYTLRDGPPGRAPPGARVRVQPVTDGGRRLDSGALRATVPGRGTVLLADLTAADTRLAGPVLLPSLVVEGRHGAPPSRDRLAIETEGPVRTELLLTGRYADGIAYELRIAAFAGQQFLRLRLTLVNLGDARYAPLRSLALAFPGPFTAVAVGLDGGTRDLDLAAAHELIHLDATPALLDGAGAGRHADGWLSARTDGGVLALVAPWFWQEYPKAFRASRERVALDLFAGEDAPLQFGTGAAKTHELWIALEPEAHAMPATDLAAALDEPLVATPPAAWMVATRALPNAIDPAEPGASEFLDRLASAYARYRDHQRTERWDDGPPVPCNERTSEHPRVGQYGVFNWGDWQFPGYRDRVRGCDGWGNLEYDLTQVLGLAWAATGRRTFLDGFDVAARHYRDVDIIHHFPGHPDWVGLNHPHKALHFATESPETIDLGHTWTEGLITYHRLTGDVRALEAARGIGDVLVRLVPRARNPRQFGWPLLALAALEDATGDRRYLDAARASAMKGTTVFRPTPAAGDWKMGILADGVAAVHAPTHDPTLRDWLVRYADALVAEPRRWPDPRFALPLGYLALVTGNRRYEEEGRATVASMKIGDWGKPLAAIGRVGFRILGPLAEEQRRSGPSTPARAATPPRSAPAPRPRSRSPGAPRPPRAD